MALTPIQVLSGILLRLFPKRRVEGVRITFTDMGVDRDTAVAQLAAAFETLRHVDQRHLRAVKRYLRHVVVWAGDYTACDPLGRLHLASSYLAGLPDTVLASVLVHEATHLRLVRHGIKYDSEKRARIERLCIAQQADFLRKVPDEGPELAAELERALESPWWTDEAHRERVERVFADNDLPRWLVPLLHRPR